MGRISVEIDLANNEDVVRARDGTLPEEKVRRTRLQGLVDTGASYLVLPEKVVTQLGFRAGGEASVRYADRRTATRPLVEEVRLELLGRHGNFRALVEPDRDTALIGAIVLEDLDLLVDCRTQTLHPRDPNRIIAEVE